MTTTPDNIEWVSDRSNRKAGFTYEEEIPLPIGWRDTGDPSAILTDSTVPVLDQAASLYDTIVWVAADTTTAQAMNQWKVPDHYADGENFLQMIVDARKFDAGAVNADLALTLAVSWQNPGETATDSITTLSEVLGAPVTSGNGGWAEYIFDIGNALEQASKRIMQGAIVVCTLSVNETVGTSNRVEVRGTRRCYKRHVRATDPNDRD